MTDRPGHLADDRLARRLVTRAIYETDNSTH
jgi:hypothetical protein